MFGWIKSLFGVKKIEPLVLTQEDLAPAREPKVEQAEPVAKPKKQAKKPATKKVATVDLDGMSKKDLLALCKEKGIKANASLKKDELIARIKNG